MHNTAMVSNGLKRRTIVRCIATPSDISFTIDDRRYQKGTTWVVSANTPRVNLRQAAALVAAASTDPIHHSAQVYAGSPAQRWSLGSTASRAPSAAGRR